MKTTCDEGCGRAARILIFTGPGKGKTTAALGMILRCVACGKKVLLARFTKAAHSGEVGILSNMSGVTVMGGGLGMTPSPNHPDYPVHVAAARDLFEKVRAEASRFDVVVMDEICGVASRGMVGEDEVAAFLKTLRRDQIAVLTGRGAGLKLMAVADTVSEIECVKHGYRRGIQAQKGVEL